MKRWIEGDLTGVDPRLELELLRTAAQNASAQGVSMDAFWHALAAKAPIAAAELAVGARPVLQGTAVLAALPIAEALEEVVAPQTLYQRFVDLGPEVAETVLALAARRHPEASWLARLASVEDIPGTIHLQTASQYGQLPAAARICAEADFQQALIALAADTGSLEPAVALHRMRNHSACAQAAAAALDHDPSAPVLPWLAAVHGPDLDALLASVVPHLRTDAARSSLQLVAASYSSTSAALKGL